MAHVALATNEGPPTGSPSVLLIAPGSAAPGRFGSGRERAFVAIDGDGGGGDSGLHVRVLGRGRAVHQAAQDLRRVVVRDALERRLGMVVGGGQLQVPGASVHVRRLRLEMHLSDASRLKVGAYTRHVCDPPYRSA